MKLALTSGWVLKWSEREHRWRRRGQGTSVQCGELAVQMASGVISDDYRASVEIQAVNTGCICQARCCHAVETSNPETQGLNTTKVYFFHGYMFDVNQQGNSHPCHLETQTDRGSISMLS